MKNFFKSILNIYYWIYRLFRWHLTLFNCKQIFQKITRGYSDVEVWNLDRTIAKFIIPRLKYFKKITQSYPPVSVGTDNYKEGINIFKRDLEIIIEGFEMVCNDYLSKETENIIDNLENFGYEKYKEFQKRDLEKIKNSLKLFAKYFNGLNY